MKQRETCNLCGKAIHGRSKTIVVSARGGIFHFNCNKKFVRITNEYNILIAALKKNGYRFTKYQNIVHSIRQGQLRFKR
jgi:hypothetical protein